MPNGDFQDQKPWINEPEILRVHFDGSCRLTTMGLGVAIIDAQDHVLALRCSGAGPGNNFLAEFMAAQDAVDFIGEWQKHSKNTRQWILYGDNMGVVRLLRKDSMPNYTPHSPIHQIYSQLRQSLGPEQCRRIVRQHNREADLAALVGRALEIGVSRDSLDSSRQRLIADLAGGRFSQKALAGHLLDMPPIELKSALINPQVKSLRGNGTPAMRSLLALNLDGDTVDQLDESSLEMALTKTLPEGFGRELKEFLALKLIGLDCDMELVYWTTLKGILRGIHLGGALTRALLEQGVHPDPKLYTRTREMDV